MKKTTKIINGDKVTIIQGDNVDLDDDLAEEYDLEKLDLKPNPYATRLRSQNKLTVQLDSDISEYFRNSRDVNNYLRKQITLIQRVVKT
ncbi:MAG: hypothetical protein V1779_07635 [bacterium]